jgi:putative FmdB family regulatory protein
MMPIYEYRCTACGHAFELLVRRGDSPVCPECDSAQLERRTSLPTVQSSGTRAQALRAAKKRDKAQATDRMHERLKYEESHDRHG